MKTETDMLLDDLENQLDLLELAPKNAAENIADRAHTTVTDITAHNLDADQEARIKKFKDRLSNLPEDTDDDDGDPFDDRFHEPMP